MDERDLRRERTQNLWTSFVRKFPAVGRATSLDAVPALPFERIGGLASAKEEVLTYACAATHPEVYARWGTFPPSGLLLIGPRGSGKSLLAQALATRAERAYLRIAVPRLVIELLHSGGRIAELQPAWSQALAELPPLAVFFDELEFSQAQELGAIRADLPIGPVMDFLLDLIDRTIAADTTLVVAATSHPDTLRHAFVAPGRFERLVEVLPAFPDDIIAALRIHAEDAEKRAGRPLFESVDWSEVVRGYREPSTGDWVLLLHSALRRKARGEAAGELDGPVRTRDLKEEVELMRRTQNRLPAAARGIYL